MGRPYSGIKRVIKTLSLKEEVWDKIETYCIENDIKYSHFIETSALEKLEGKKQ